MAVIVTLSPSLATEWSPLSLLPAAVAGEAASPLHWAPAGTEISLGRDARVEPQLLANGFHVLELVPVLLPWVLLY